MKWVNSFLEKPKPLTTKFHESRIPECSKKSVQQGRSHFDARSVHVVREHGKKATCLREAAPAKAGNAGGGFFQHFHY
jgi:hypothetical protein